MAVYFDNVLEYLTEDDKALYKYLSSLKKQLLAADICPRGELERSFMCRQYLRDSTNKVQKNIKDSGMVPGKVVIDILEQTYAVIEEIGTFSEVERVAIVVRNLLILMENVTLQKEGKKLPVRVPVRKNKKEFEILSCEITENGKTELLKLLGIAIDLDAEDLNKPLVNEKVMKAVNKAKVIANGLEENAVEERYRTIFYYLAIEEVLRREKAL